MKARGVYQPNPSVRMLGVVGAFVLLSLGIGFRPTLASATGWETVKYFAPLEIPKPNPSEWPEDTQLGGVSGMAVNRTGAGGVKPGTLYTAGYDAGATHVARFSPAGEFELGWRGLNRCGPKSGKGACPPAATGGVTGIDVDIDQATGNVYVFAESTTEDVIRVYNPDGSMLITKFGEPDIGGTIATSPTKFHKGNWAGGIAVNDEGRVYLFDEDKNFVHRLMIFEPKTPGVFSEYEYGGEIINGPLAMNAPTSPVLDDAGHVYVGREDYLEEFSSTGVKLCEFSFNKGGITSITVNPVSEEPFFFTYKEGRIHRLTSCQEGKFTEEATVSAFQPVPKRGDITAMAVNPELEWTEEPSPGVEVKHPIGTLYAGAATNCPSIGSCPSEAQGQSSLGYIFVQAVSHIPEVEAESVSGVGTTSATLRALINPKGSQTSFVFQYLTEEAYREAGETFTGALETPIGGAALGSGQKPLLASVSVAGLVPGTEYRYRVIATSAEGSDEGGVASFATFPPAAGVLPDGRAFELVSPPQKSGGEVIPAAPLLASCGFECKPGSAGERFPAIATSEGDSVAYQGSPFTRNTASSEYDEYVARRGPGGWQSVGLSPPMMGDSGGRGFEAFDLNASLSEAIVDATNRALTPQTSPGYGNLMREAVGNPLALEPFVLAPDPEDRSTSGSNSWELRYAGASADFSRFFFAANDALSAGTAVAPAAVDGGVGKLNLYEWSAGQLRLVNVQPGNAETIPGAAFGSGTTLDEMINPVDDLAGAISEDGSRVFWSSESGQLYVRENAGATLSIPGSGPAARFLAAAPDGSTVLLSNGQLLELNEEAEIYEPTTDLTEGEGGFKGLVGQSVDLSRLYFVDEDVLDPTPNEFGDTAQPGKPNLYSWQEGTSTFVTTLLAKDNPELGTWTAPPVRRSAEASPDGRYLAFGSKADLTGVESVGPCEFSPGKNKWIGSVPCEEVFLYDSVTGELSCPSCNPTASAPLGGSFLRLEHHAQGHLPQPRYLTDSGRLYFDSRDSLTALDTNNGVEDVYQYEPEGVGLCEEEVGCVDLVSSGRGNYDANFLAIDGAGNNVFFTTRNQLLPIDTDQLIDLYDARAGGGIAEPQSPVPCGENCRPPGPPPPVEPLATTQTFEGSGNASKRHAKHKKKQQKKAKGTKKHKKVKRGAKAKQGGSK